MNAVNVPTTELRSRGRSCVHRQRHQRREAERMAERENDRSGEQARRDVPEADHEQPGRDEHERGAGGALRAERVRDPATDDPRRDDDGRVDEEDRAAAVEAELARVERAEGAQARESEDHEREHEAGADRCRVDESCRRAAGRAPVLGAVSGSDESDERGREAAAACEQPDRVEAIRHRARARRGPARARDRPRGRGCRGSAPRRGGARARGR